MKEILSSEKYLFYQGNSIKSGVLQYIWIEYSSTDAETSSFELGEVSIRSVLNIFVSQSTKKSSSIGISFSLNFLKFKFVCVIWESLKEILSSEK